MHISKTNETVILWLDCFLEKFKGLLAILMLFYLGNKDPSLESLNSRGFSKTSLPWLTKHLSICFLFLCNLSLPQLLPSTIGFSPKSNPWYLVFCLPFRKYFLQLQLWPLFNFNETAPPHYITLNTLFNLFETVSQL